MFADIEIAGHALNSTVMLAVLALLLAWIAVYLIYKVAFHADFGIPVRRRLLVRSLQVQRDQVAFVPLWWSDLQIQRAVRAHWKSSLRSTVAPAPTRRAPRPEEI
ncbi:MAG: hypothetical protein ACYDAC_07665 [Candidatus Dormibacteria bacterium]